MSCHTIRSFATYYWPWLPVFLAGLFMEREGRSLTFAWLAAVLLPLTLSSTPYGRTVSDTGVPLHGDRSRRFPAPLDSRWAEGRVLIRHPSRSTGAHCLHDPFPPRERAKDIRAVAVAAQANSAEHDRLLLHTFGERRYDVQNQLLWYSDRYTNHILDTSKLQAQHSPGRVGIMDKSSFFALPDRGHLVVLAESDLFLCYIAR